MRQPPTMGVPVSPVPFDGRAPGASPGAAPDLTSYSCELVRGEVAGFERGKYSIRATHYAGLLSFAQNCIQLHRDEPQTVLALRVAGYTDPSGSPEVNRGLSFSRALEVGRFLSNFLRMNRVFVRLHVEGKGVWMPPGNEESSGGSQDEGNRVELSLCSRQ